MLHLDLRLAVALREALRLADRVLGLLGQSVRIHISVTSWFGRGWRSARRRASSRSSPSNRSTRSTMIAAPSRFTCRSRRRRSIRRSRTAVAAVKAYGSGPLDSISPRRTRRGEPSRAQTDGRRQLVEGRARSSMAAQLRRPAGCRRPWPRASMPRRPGARRRLGRSGTTIADDRVEVAALHRPRAAARGRAGAGAVRSGVPGGTVRVTGPSSVSTLPRRRGPPATATAPDPSRGRHRPPGSAGAATRRTCRKRSPRRPAVDAGLALSGQAQHRAVARAGRDLDLDRVGRREAAGGAAARGAAPPASPAARPRRRSPEG